jgi:hypothetical protein
MPLPNNANAKFEQVEGCEITQMPDGYVVYQGSREKVHYLNPTAAIIYELCGERMPIGDIADYLRASFSLPAPPTTEVEACIESLLTENLIKSC